MLFVVMAIFVYVCTLYEYLEYDDKDYDEKEYKYLRDETDMVEGIGEQEGVPWEANNQQGKQWKVKWKSSGKILRTVQYY